MWRKYTEIGRDCMFVTGKKQRVCGHSDKTVWLLWVD